MIKDTHLALAVESGTADILQVLSIEPLSALQVERKLPDMDRTRLFTRLNALVAEGLLNRSGEGDNLLILPCAPTPTGETVHRLLAVWRGLGLSLLSLPKVVKGRWNREILEQLCKEGPLTQKVLAEALPGLRKTVMQDRLKDLEAAGLIQRKTWRTRPPIIAYALVSEAQAVKKLIVAAWPPS